MQSQDNILTQIRAYYLRINNVMLSYNLLFVHCEHQTISPLTDDHLYKINER